MTRLLLAAATTVAAVLLAPPAHAGTASWYRGGCGFDGVRPSGLTGDPTLYHGHLYARTVLYSTEAADNPVSADVTCTLRATGGALIGQATFSGTGVVTGSIPIEFRSENSYDDGPWLCETVDFTSDDTPTETLCDAHTSEQFPPEYLFELEDQVLANAPGSRVAICAVLVLAGWATPDQYGGITIGQDGTVYSYDDAIWRCP
jgi:hypothetical protein